jgi:hypothetical protein
MEEKKYISLPVDIGDWFYLVYSNIPGEILIWTEHIEIISATKSKNGTSIKLYGSEVCCEIGDKRLFFSYKEALEEQKRLQAIWNESKKGE